MKPSRALLMAGPVVLTAALLVTRPFASEATAATSALESVVLPQTTYVKPPPTLPDARFARSIYASTSMPGSGVMLDLCRGPVAIDLGASYPTLIAEHDYCGGAAWIPELNEGDVVRLDGKGVDAGQYVVSEIGFGERRAARFSDLPEAELVLQTCISETKIILVGLERVADSVPA